MKAEENWKPLKLRAEDDIDLLVFTECLHQAIVFPSELIFDKNSKQFAIAVERFTWEIAKGKDHELRQVLSILLVNGVLNAEFDKKLTGDSIYNIVSISNVDNNILILLNNDEVINLKVKDWNCILEDVGRPIWPAISPSHLTNE